MFLPWIPPIERWIEKAPGHWKPVVEERKVLTIRIKQLLISVDKMFPYLEENGFVK